ncbi:hypothetical protein V6N11_017515 [Hibiscus sabdariffa]|uniref:RNase H type-1 domain-containing protein n=1 Tax=Hibiscus sabdariffa TaxID=183260 RepID=A0ABR2TYT1_9ROSI
MSTSAAGLSNCDNRLPVPGALRVGVRWQKPPLGWCKLNTDVAVSLVTSEASCDGVVHDDLGSYLTTTWSLRIDKLVVELDCLEEVKLFDNMNDVDWCVALVPYILELLQRQWQVRLVHVLREGNCVTDWLSKHLPLGDFLSHHFMSPSAGILDLLQQDDVK